MVNGSILPVGSEVIQPSFSVRSYPKAWSSRSV